MKFLNWLDNNLLAILAGFLLMFIPLYPKLPLFDILPGYNVRVRIEDIFVGVTLGFFLLQLLRKKVKLTLNPVTIGLLAYLVIGLASVLTSIFIIKTVPLELIQVGKTFLHWMRRIEYFSLFFIIFGSIKSARTLKIFLGIFFITMIGVIIYGFGQKYLYWPAFSTMNREFAKGWMLYLTEHARVLSTFGGHYDLAGYLVIALSLSWSFFFGFKKLWQKAVALVLIACGFWLLILTASRISFAGYILGTSVVIFLWMFRRSFEWAITRWFVVIFLSILLMLSFGDLSDRFLHLLRLDERVANLQNVLLKPSGAPPTNNAAFLENNTAAVTSNSDMPPTPVRPSDVSGKEERLFIATYSATGEKSMIEKPRTYSANAIQYDLSTAIRLDATWPRAIRGFMLNPILGSGYATLTKTYVEEFTEGESTDNGYLRALGETGLLGFLGFFGTIALMIYFAFKSLGGIKDPTLYSLTAGFIGFTVGLLANALLIDIFEASKVAYVFWAVSGICLGALYFYRQKIKEDREPMVIKFDFKKRLASLKKFLVSDVFFVGVILLFGFILHTNQHDAPVADWHSWRQADTSSVTRNFISSQKVNWLYPTYHDLSSIASGLPNPNGFRFVEFPIYNAAGAYLKLAAPELTTESVGRIVTSISSALTVLFLFLICRRLIGRRVAYLAAITYTVLPYNLFYGRVILPDPTMVMFGLGATYFTVKYIFTNKIRWFALSIVFTIFAVLIKPISIFLLLPIVYLWFQSYGFNWKKWLMLGLGGAIAVIPFILWRLWISNFPEGIPASDWLFNGNGIRFKGAFWYWIFADRIGRLILGYWGLILLGFGLIRKMEGKYKLYPILLALGSFLYLVVIATGNVQHDYYQILIVPSLAIFVALGIDFLISSSTLINKFASKILAVVCFIFMIAFGWYFVKDYFNINHPEIVAAGKAVNELIPQESKVIAPYGGDTAFLYQTNRAGWPIVQGSIDQMVKDGADFYVSTNFDDLTNELLKDSATPEMQKYLSEHDIVQKKYTTVKLTDKNDPYQFVIIQLVPEKDLRKN